MTQARHGARDGDEAGQRVVETLERVAHGTTLSILEIVFERVVGVLTTAALTTGVGIAAYSVYAPAGRDDPVVLPSDGWWAGWVDEPICGYGTYRGNAFYFAHIPSVVAGTTLDSRGRLTLPQELREQYGDQFHIVDVDDGVKLIPVADDPLAALREEFADVDASVAELRRDARGSVGNHDEE